MKSNHRHSAGGWHGTLSHHFFQVVRRLRKTVKRHFWPLLTQFLVLGVICGCLVSIGIKPSTVSAQAATPLFFPVARRLTRKQLRKKQAANANIAASYSRYSSEMQNDDSIEAQQRTCRERAIKNMHKLLSRLEFFDAAISGTLLNRESFDRMLDAARDGEFSVLYLFSLSRFARSCHITMTLLLRLVFKYKVCVICVAEGIDTNEEGWQVKAQLHAIMDEQYVLKTREFVICGQKNNQMKDLSNGDYCFGYRSEAISGSEVGRRGKDPKPYKRIVVDSDEAGWVLKIFEWFVVNLKSISWMRRN